MPEFAAAVLVMGAHAPGARMLRLQGQSCGVEVVDVSASDLAGLDREFGLAVVSGARERRLLQSIECVRSLGCPIVVLDDGGLDSNTAFRLPSLGICAVIDVRDTWDEALARALTHYDEAASRSTLAGKLVGKSRLMRELRDQIAAVARTASTVLLVGETGTGKGLVARAIHELSENAGRPLVHADCTVFSPSVIESELFGHEKGAFTTANSRHLGRFELAADGTIFLDEIGELDLSLQPKLLRVLEDRVFERVGGGRPIPMVARVMAATNSELVEAVETGRFRADLYFRLKVFEIRVPPLRRRLEDVPELVATHLRAVSLRLGVLPPQYTSDFCDALQQYSWPGNVRELVNVIERCVVERPGAVLDHGSLQAMLSAGPSIGRRSSALRPTRVQGAGRLVGSSLSMRTVRDRISEIASAATSVLITGEPGTGKEIAALAMHEESGRDPWMAIGIQDLSSELLELELFGREGGFPEVGGSGPRAGLLERAKGGTLFLDGIGEMPLPLQAKLLHVLETGTVRRLGADRLREVDVRTIAATHRDLSVALREGRFRGDLLHRLSESTVCLPSLRDHPDDIAAIARALIQDLARESQLRVPELAPQLLDSLSCHPLTGNLRELRAMLQNLLTSWDGRSRLEQADLLRLVSLATPYLSTGDLAVIQQMVSAYRRCDGNQEAARRELGFSRGEWRHRWARYKLDVFRRRR